MPAAENGANNNESKCSTGTTTGLPSNDDGGGGGVHLNGTAPAASTAKSLSSNIAVVSYDLDTTGRRLLDEICQIGAHYTSQDLTEGESYTQYVMPHRNPKLPARRAFGISVVNIGRSRMLKDLKTGKVLKTKSEISALQDFLSWLEKAVGEKEGIILVSHEQERRILVPLLIQSLDRYNLMPAFSKLVKGFCNSADVISDLGNKAEITSMSLRSLCKTVLHDTSLSTTTAVERCKRVLEILTSVTSGKEGKKVDLEKILTYIVSVDDEILNLKKLQKIEEIQRTLRPIFGSLLGGGWQTRERMVRIRAAMAAADIDYKTLQSIQTREELEKRLSTVNLAEEEEKKEMIAIVTQHCIDNPLNTQTKPETETKVKIAGGGEQDAADAAVEQLPPPPNAQQQNKLSAADSIPATTTCTEAVKKEE